MTDDKTKTETNHLAAIEARVIVNRFFDLLGNYKQMNYNCPDDEKQGEGPGSCGGRKETEREIAVLNERIRFHSKGISTYGDKPEDKPKQERVKALLEERRELEKKGSKTTAEQKYISKNKYRGPASPNQLKAAQDKIDKEIEILDNKIKDLTERIKNAPSSGENAETLNKFLERIVEKKKLLDPFKSNR